MKRFEAHYLTEGAMGGKALAVAQCVLASDYDRLEQELKRLKADRSACWAEFKVMTRSCLDAEKERDELRAKVEAMQGLLHDIKRYGVHSICVTGPSIMERIDAALQAKP